MDIANTAKKILLVEDDDDFRETLQYALSSPDRAVTAVNCAAQFRKIAGDRFELAIIDINLPDDSGFALVRHVRESSSTRIIILSGRDTMADRVEGYTNGADIYMVKPTAQ